MAKKWIGYIGVGSLMCAALGCGILFTRQARLQQTISDKVLRFHVLANSDSEADQNLKLAVRDAVGSFMQEKLAAVENLEECELVVDVYKRQQRCCGAVRCAALRQLLTLQRSLRCRSCLLFYWKPCLSWSQNSSHK